MNQTKLIILALSFLFVSAPSIWAQNTPSFKQITGLQLIEYSQALYERGQYNEAASILTRALKLQPTNQKAIKMAAKLKMKGEHITIPLEVKESLKAVSKKQSMVNDVKSALNKREVKVDSINLKSTENLRSQIKAAHQQIDQLKEEISVLNEQLLK